MGLRKMCSDASRCATLPPDAFICDQTDVERNTYEAFLYAGQNSPLVCVASLAKFCGQKCKKKMGEMAFYRTMWTVNIKTIFIEVIELRCLHNLVQVDECRGAWCISCRTLTTCCLLSNASTPLQSPLLQVFDVAFQEAFFFSKSPLNINMPPFNL